MTDLYLPAIDARRERVYSWIGEDPAATADVLPDDVVQFFTADVPALLSRVRHLETELAAAEHMLAILAGREGS